MTFQVEDRWQNNIGKALADGCGSKERNIDGFRLVCYFLLAGKISVIVGDRVVRITATGPGEDLLIARIFVYGRFVHIGDDKLQIWKVMSERSKVISMVWMDAMVRL